MKHDYSFLRQPLLTFVEQQWISFKSIQEHQKAWNDGMFIDRKVGRTPWKSLVNELGLEDKEFAAQFLDPWKELSLSQLETILNYWNWAHRFRFGKELSLRPIVEINALHWTVVHIFKLNLPGLIVFEKEPSYFETNDSNPKLDFITRLYLAEPYSLPMKQCIVCGRLDQDPRGKPFDKQGLHYCHLDNCITSSVNLPDHDEGCCYRKWNSRKDALIRTMRNQKSQEKTIQIFLKFCQSQYDINCLASNYVKTEKEKPMTWKLVWEDLEKKSRKHNQ